MPQSLVKNDVHIIFSTKHREQFIVPEIEDELFNYLGGTCNALDCQSIKVGGWLDHVHILCMLSRKIALMKLLEEIKSHSSGWIKTKGAAYANFYWQNGYAAFSVGQDGIVDLIKYIENQKQHHRTESYQDELRRIFKLYKMEYDERYVWD